MSFIDLFSSHAALYAASRPRYPDDLFAFIASQAPARHRAWDCGTGNGQAAVSLSRHFAEVLATDPSEGQLAQATPTANVRYSAQRAEGTDFHRASIDAICVAQALHWFDFDGFFSEVRRVAVPGALFAAWGYTSFSVSEGFDAAFQLFISDVVAPYWAPQNKLLWDGYVDVPMPFPRIAAPRFQIDAEWSLGQLLAYVRTWSAARRCISERGRGFVEAAEARLAGEWGNADEARPVTMPLHLVVGRVNAARE